MKYDLTIALRAYPGIIARQQVFCDDKFTLYKKSLQSCIQWLGNLKCFIYILLDNCPLEYLSYTKDALQDIDHEIINYDHKQGNAQTFAKQVELLSTQSHSEIVFFLEDDYIHLPWSIQQFVHMMQDNPNVPFGTSYFSPDYQNMLLHRYRIQQHYYQWHIYGEVASTTMTFFTRKTVLHKYKQELLSYSKGNHDFSMRYSMTKLGIYNLSNMLTALFRDFFQVKLFGYIRYKCWRYIIHTPKTKLYVPLLSWSTHTDSKWLAPWTDRHKIWKSITI